MLDRWVFLCGEAGGNSRLYGTYETTPVLVGVSRQGFGRSQPLAPRTLDGGTGTAFRGLYLDGTTWTDLVVGTPNTTVSSAAQPFTSSHVGLSLYVLTGPLAVGRYQINSVVGGVATLSASPGAIGTSGGTATTGAEHGFLWATPFSHGAYPSANGGTIDAYSITDQITVEWQQDLGTSLLQTGPVMGLSTILNNGQPCPWWIGFTPPGGDWNAAPGTAGAIRVRYAIKDGSKYGLAKNASFALPSLPAGKVDFCVTISPRQGTVVAWAGSGGTNLQLTPIAGGFSDPFPAPGSKFQPNQHIPFQLGSDSELLGGGLPNTGANFQTEAATATGKFAGMNRNFTGLRFRNDAPYVLTNAAGSAQARGDSGPIDPGNAYGARYKRQEAGVLAWIPFDDAPGDVVGNRQFAVCFGNGAGYSRSVCGYIGPSYPIGLDRAAGGLRDLTMGPFGGSFGGGLGIGAMGDYSIRDCTFGGGLYGIGSLGGGSAYTLTMSGLNSITALDTPFHTYQMDVKQTGLLRFGNLGRYGLYGDHGSTFQIDYLGVMYPSTQLINPVYVSGYLQANEILVDFEYNINNLQSYIRMNSYANGSLPNFVMEIDNLYVGNITPGLSAVYIDTADADQVVSPFRIGNFECNPGVGRAVVEVAGATARCVSGVIEETFPVNAPLVLNSTTDGRSGLVAIHRPDALRRTGGFALGSSVLRPSRAVDGQFTEFRCTQAGSYHQGSPGLPPRWAGTGVLDDSGAGLATYIQANLAWTASGNAIPAVGMPSNFAACQFLDSYFGLGQVSTNSSVTSALTAGVSPPPTSITCALLTAPADGTSTLPGGAEVTNPGYARQAATFGASTGGVIANGAAITFPGMTGTMPTIVGVGFFDAGSGRVIGSAPLDPFVPTVSTPITFAIGKFSLQAVPVPAGYPLVQMGYVSPSLLDMHHNWLLRAGAITPGAGLQFALSTAPASLAPPTEPSGGGYARVNAGPWQQTVASGTFPTGSPPGQIPGATSNASSVAFPAVTGAGYAARSIYLLDGSSNVIVSGNLTVPRTFSAGQVPTISGGAVWISW